VYEVFNNRLLKRKNISADVKNINITGEMGFLKDDISQILINEDLAFKSLHFTVNPKTMLITNLNDSLHLEDIIKNDGKLVFYYGDQYCELCYKELINLINKYINKTGTKNIIVLAEYENARNLYFFLKNNEIKTDVYFLPKGIDLPVQKEKKPFFFMLDNSFKTNFVYVPHKQYLNHIDNYFGAMDRYLNE
jgi:hypothetical protein